MSLRFVSRSLRSDSIYSMVHRSEQCGEEWIGGRWMNAFHIADNLKERRALRKWRGWEGRTAKSAEQFLAGSL